MLNTRYCARVKKSGSVSKTGICMLLILLEIEKIVGNRWVSISIKVLNIFESKMRIKRSYRWISKRNGQNV